MCPIYADGIVNSVDPHHTAPAVSEISLLQAGCWLLVVPATFSEQPIE